MKLDLGKFIDNKCPKDCSAVEKDTELLTCQQCQALSEECMIQMDYKDICKKKGLDKDNKCAADYCPMGNATPTTCADCEEVLGQDCVNRVSHFTIKPKFDCVLSLASKKFARTWVSRKANVVASARTQLLPTPVRSVSSLERLVSAKLAPRRHVKIFSTKRASAYHHAQPTSPKVHQIAHNVMQSVHDVLRSLVTKRAARNSTGIKRRVAQRTKIKYHRRKHTIQKFSIDKLTLISKKRLGRETY